MPKDAKRTFEGWFFEIYLLCGHGGRRFVHCRFHVPIWFNHGAGLGVPYIPGSLYHGVSQLCLVSTCDFRAISARFSVHPWLNGGRKKRLGSRRCIHFIERKTWKNYERTNGGPMGSGWTKTKNWSNCRGIPRFQTLNTKPDASWLQAPRKSSFHFPCSLAQVVSNWLGHQSVLN